MKSDLKMHVNKTPMSRIRKSYFCRLVGRCIISIFYVLLFVFSTESYGILDGMNFFSGFSVLHIIWAIWVVDMLLQLIPVKAKVALGSQKLFADRYQPIEKKINYKALHDYIVHTTKAACKVFLLWGILVTVIGILYYNGVISKIGLFMITMLFYVCDLICVLIWCPFRLIMKNKCCTTCRIFNWDHLMMFSPLLFAGGFFSVSLLVMAFAAWLVWELSVIQHPERFWEMTNVSLTCAECTDKLCTQYCQKQR